MKKGYINCSTCDNYTYTLNKDEECIECSACIFKIFNVLQGNTAYFSEALNMYIYHEKHPVKGHYMTHLTDGHGEIISDHNSVREAIEKARSKER